MRQPLSLASFLLLTTIGTAQISCLAQSWQIPTPELSDSQSSENKQNAQLIDLYIPDYLSRGPSASHRPLETSPHHMVIDAFIKRLSDQNTAYTFRFTKTPSGSGIFCAVRLEENEPSAMSSFGMILTTWSLWLIPFYDSTIEYRVTYELFINASLKKSYSYLVRGKTMTWAFAPLAIPFMSDHWEILMLPPHQSVSDSFTESLLASLTLFQKDARRDGFFR
jgi:hypothetical protein